MEEYWLISFLIGGQTRIGVLRVAPDLLDFEVWQLFYELWPPANNYMLMWSHHINRELAQHYLEEGAAQWVAVYPTGAAPDARRIEVDHLQRGWEDVRHDDDEDQPDEENE